MEAARLDRGPLVRGRSGDEVPGGRAPHHCVHGGACADAAREGPRFRHAEGPARARDGEVRARDGDLVLAEPVHAESRRRLGRAGGSRREVPRAVLLSGLDRRGDLHLLLLPQAPAGAAVSPGRARAGARRSDRQRRRPDPARVRDRLHRLALVRSELDEAVVALAHVQPGRQRHHRGAGDAVPRDALGEESVMLPVLFTLTIPPSLGIVVWLAVSALSGAWQVRSARAAGESTLLKTFVTWTAGTAAVLFVAVRALGGQNILHPERPL